MTRLVKIVLIAVASVIGLAFVASVAVMLLFDPNDYREEIAAGVHEATGRELVIDGELSLSIFPWLAIEMGHISLGNAEGFGDEPMLGFDSASFSVQLLPLIFDRRVAIGTASLDGLTVNLEVQADGRNNWDDLSAAGDAPPPGERSTDGSDEGGAPDLDVNNIRISNASLSYSDRQAGSAFSLSGLTIGTGRIKPGTPFDLEMAFDFSADPGATGGHIELVGEVLLAESLEQLSVEGLNISGTLEGIVEQPTDFNFDSRAIHVDMAAQSLSPGEMDLSVLGLDMTANVQPFSYAGTPKPQASLRVMEFSLKDLMETLGTPAPETSDPAALTRVSFSAEAGVTETELALKKMELELDDTTMSGNLGLPLTESGAITFDLNADSIVLDHYMAPAGDEAADDTADASGDEIEIPVEMIRALNAKGSAKLGKAMLSGMTFENLELGVSSAGGKLRLHPIAAEFFDGSYAGDVRIDASGSTPSISVNENISGVNLGSLAKSMFGQENVTGTINGKFVLGGRGENMSAIRRDLDGTMSFQLADGAFEGTDVWYQLRSARALLRKEAPPEAPQPPRTEFTAVSMSGTVTDGVFVSDDLLAELPFLRLTGAGSVNFAEANMNYSVQARVIDQPEFVDPASESELADFTAAVIPLRISGPLASPSIKPDVEVLVRREVERAVEKEGQKLLNRLLGGEDQQPPPEGEPADEGEEEEELSPEDQVKKALKDLIPRR